MMLFRMFINLTLVTVALAAVFRIGWSVAARQISEPLQPAERQESVQRPLDPVSASLPRTKPSAPLERRGEQDALRPAAATALDLNRASAKDFERLPGVGPVLAGRIIEYRASQGMFHDVEQLREVKGIGPKKFEQIRPHVAVAPAGKAPRKAA
jgi:competence protein ComEA